MWNENTSTHSWGWNTSNLSDGTYQINITAYFNDSSQTNATQNNVTVYVTNTMQGTPGVDLWQGGNFSVTFNKSGLSEYSKHILDSSSTPTSSLYYGNTVNVTVNSTLGWESDTYYLYYPAYVGEKDAYDYDLKWKRYRGSPDPSITPTTDYTFEDITLNTSGIWLIVNSSALVSQANLSTIELYNITVPAWFWVNTSTTYEMEVSETSFRYNSSGAVSLTVTDADGQPAPCVVDIRRQENQSSILSQNYHTGGDGIKDDFYKNRSYFWTAGNYTAWAYVDLDDYGTNNGGTTTYGENNLDNSSDGHKHYNDTYGANAAKNGFPGWTGFGTGAKEAYNYSLCGPWDPPEYNVSNQQIVVQTGEIDWSCEGCDQQLKELRGCESPTQIPIWAYEELEFHYCPLKWITHQILNWFNEYQLTKKGLVQPLPYNKRQSRWCELANLYEVESSKKEAEKMQKEDKTSKGLKTLRTGFKRK
jgi:hypothetical protein